MAETAALRGPFSIGQLAYGENRFRTRGFYLACFLRCTGEELFDLRAEGRNEVLSSATGLPGARPAAFSQSYRLSNRENRR